MKIREAIETVDRLLPNQYETPDKVRWLSELDGIVYRDIICTHEHEKEPEPFTGYGEDVDLETELLIPWPYDEIYRWYLGMKICDANGETTKYANEADISMPTTRRTCRSSTRHISSFKAVRL